ncbi:MAG: NYN domain-containing protein [Myxococcota bacterium]
MDRNGRNPLESWIEAEVSACPGRSILVDGFNVLHAAILRGRRGRDWWSAETREPLLERVTSWPEPADVVWVVFDGAESSWVVRLGDRRRAEPTVHVVFARSADDWIVRRARRAPDPARLVVVSADREVTGRARSAGCEILAPRTFVARCGPADRVTGAATAPPTRVGDDQAPGSIDGGPADPGTAGGPATDPSPPRPSPKADS